MAIIVQDSFTGQAGSIIGSIPNIGSAWKKFGAQSGIERDGTKVFGQIYPYDNNFAYNDTALISNGYCQVDVAPFSNISYLLGRVVDNLNHYAIRMYTGAQGIDLIKTVNGTVTVLGTYGTTLGGNIFKLEFNGTSINAYLDGTLRISAIDGSFSSGYVGIFPGYNTAGFDNFEAGTLAPPALTNLTLACGV